MKRSFSRSGCPTYLYWTEQAERWSKCVDYGSVMSAWTDRMNACFRQAGGDTKIAAALLSEWRKREGDER